MITKANRPKGQRTYKSVKYNFSKEHKTKIPFNIAPAEFGWMFNLESGQWENENKTDGDRINKYFYMVRFGFKNAYSLKAVKRLIHKWDVPKGTVFFASLPFEDDYFIITK